MTIAHRLAWLLLAVALGVAPLAAQDIVTIAAPVGTAYEGNSQPAVFRLTRDGAGSALTVTLGFSGNADRAADYSVSIAGVFTGGATVPVTIAAGATAAEVLVYANDDLAVEKAETVVATLASGSGYTVGSPNSAEILIGDDDIQLNLVTVNPTARETPVNGQFIDCGRFDLAWSANGAAYNGTGFPVQIDVRSTTTATMGTDCFLAYRPNTFAGNFQATGWDPLLSEVTVAKCPGNLKKDDYIWLLNDSAPRQVQTTATGSTVWKLTSVPDGIVLAEIAAARPVDAFYAKPGNFPSLSTNLPDHASSLQLWLVPLQDVLPEGEEVAEFTVLSSPNFKLPNPTTTMIRFADDDVRVGIRQVSHTAESTPGQPGVAVVEIQGGGVAPKDIAVSFNLGTEVGAASPSGSEQDFAFASGVAFSADTRTGTLTIPRNQSSATFSVMPTPDARNNEGTETVTITLLDSNDYLLVPSGGSVLNTSATINILDCQGLLSIASPSSTSAAEYPANSLIFTVTVDRSVTAGTVNVPFSWIGSASTADMTFTPALGSATSGIINIPANQTSATITVTTVDDHLYEPPENLTITIAAIADYCLKPGGATTASMTIIDDEPTIGIAAVTSVSEGQTAAAFVISILGSDPTTPATPLPYAATVTYTVDGTATAGSDYTALIGSVTIPDGQISATVAITALPDTDIETTAETVTATLSTNGTYSLPADIALHSATVSIIDATPRVALSATSSTIKEGDSAGTITATLTNPPASISASQPFVVAFTTGGSATTADVALSTTALNFTSVNLDGTATTALTINGTTDSYAEDPESFIFTAVPSATCAVVTGQNSVTITLIDSTPQIAITAVRSAVEDGQTGLAVVSCIANQPTTDLVVGFTVAGTASTGDYILSSIGNVILPPSGSATIAVTAIEDGVMEGDETVVLTLTGGYAVAGASATVTIREVVPAVALRLKQDAVEGGQAGQVEAYLADGVALARGLVVAYTASGSATAGDYTLSAATITIPAGALSGSLSVTAIEDNAAEAPETLTVALAAAVDGSYALAASSSATVTLTDYKPQVGITAARMAAEGGFSGEFTVSYAPRPALATPLTVDFSLSGTATLGLDYLPSTGATTMAVTIPANASSATITIGVIDDVLVEGSETVVVALAAARDGSYQVTAAQASAAVLISDRASNKPTTPISFAGGGGSGGCGLGSGLGLLLGAAGAGLALRRRRRS